jgi:hypothetical protein
MAQSFVPVFVPTSLSNSQLLEKYGHGALEKNSVTLFGLSEDLTRLIIKFFSDEVIQRLFLTSKVTCIHAKVARGFTEYPFASIQSERKFLRDAATVSYYRVQDPKLYVYRTPSDRTRKNMTRALTKRCDDATCRKFCRKTESHCWKHS